MSVIEPEIDKLLEFADNDRFLLCAMASKRSRDINNMILGQANRAMALHSLDELTELTGKKPLSFAFEEIVDGFVGYDKETFDEALDNLNNY